MSSNDKNMNEFKTLMYVLAVVVIVFYIYYFATRFEKTIVVKSEFVHAQHTKGNTFVATKDNEVFNVQNNALLMSFNAVEIMSKLEPGKKFKVAGYGVRVPWMGLYPVITDVKSAKKKVQFK